VERDKRREGTGDINTAQVRGRASGVACNALLGGPGAAMKLRYIVRVARQCVSMRRKARGAIAARCSRARRRRVHASDRLMRSGWRNAAALATQWK